MTFFSTLINNFIENPIVILGDKKGVLILLLICITPFVKAQDLESKIDWGIKVGYNNAQFRPFSPLPDSLFNSIRGRTGLVAGLFLSYQFNSFFSIELDGVYSGKGSGYGPYALQKPGPDKGRVSFQVNYIEIPLLAKLTLPQRKMFVSSSIGLAPSFRVSSKLIFPTIYTIFDIDYDIREWEDTALLDVGLVFGGEIGLYVSQNHALLLDVRYTFGLRQVSKTADHSRNEVLSVMFGYRF